MSQATEKQYDLLNRLVGALLADERIGAVWLEGSLARGDADPYSDIDLHAYAPFDPKEPSLSRLLEDLPEILSAAGRAVYLRTVSGTAITTGVMDDGGRFDVVLETEEDLKRPRRDVKVLSDRTGGLWSRLRFEEGPPPVRPERVDFVLRDFWRCMGLLPVGLARGELIVMFQGHAILLAYASEIAMAAEGIVRATGVKRLNAALPPPDRLALEDALPAEPTLPAFAHAMLRLAGFVSERGRDCAARTGIPYPEELESSIMRYVTGELGRFGIDPAGGAKRWS